MIVAIFHISAFNTDSIHSSSVKLKESSCFPHHHKSGFPDCGIALDLP